MSLFSWFKTAEVKTVAAVVARFHSIVAELEKVEQEALNAVGYHQDLIDYHQQKAVVEQAEADLAKKVAGNIKALVA